MNSTSDTIVIGGGLTGLLLTHRLKLAGHNVTLLEARESLGGRFRRPSLTQPYSSPILDFLPANSEHLEILEWFKNQSPISVNYSIEDHRPQIFQDGHWKAFAGFGESNFQSVSELSSLFGHSQSVNLTPALEQVTRALVEQLPIVAQTMSTVTGFKVEDGKITELTINGDKTIRAQNVIFCGDPQQLNNLFQGEDLAAKHRTRLAKFQAWTAITLELTHTPPLVEDSSVRIFNHSAKEFEPVVGRVFGEYSKWMTLVPAEREADHEFGGQCIRHIKRQMKRAWPLALADEGKATSEKIYILPNAYGQLSLKTKENLRFPEISNLYLGNHALATLPGELGALETARAIESAICGTLNKLPDVSASC